MPVMTNSFIIDDFINTSFIVIIALLIKIFPNHAIGTITFFEIFSKGIHFALIGVWSFRKFFFYCLGSWGLFLGFVIIDFSVHGSHEDTDWIYFTNLFTMIVAGFIINIYLYHKTSFARIKTFNAKRKGRVKNFEIGQFIDRLLPKHIQDSLAKPKGDIGETYKNVTMLFADICGFTAFSSGKKPSEVVKMLSELFMDFDKECDNMGLFKLYTIGDCYVVLGF